MSLSLLLIGASVAVSPPVPAANVESWVTTDDLPRGLLARDEIVRTEIHLVVSPEGRVVGCAAPTPATRPELDDLACRLVTERGRYRPPTDAIGNRMQGDDVRRIRWQVPRDW